MRENEDGLRYHCWLSIDLSATGKEIHGNSFA